MRDEPLVYSFTAGGSGEALIVKLDGPLTLMNMFGFQQELRAVSSQSLILDLSGMPYMDSAGLGLIMNAYVSAQGRGRALVLVGVTERVASLLEMTKVDTILKRFPTVESAEASL